MYIVNKKIANGVGDKVVRANSDAIMMPSTRAPLVLTFYYIRVQIEDDFDSILFATNTLDEVYLYYFVCFRDKGIFSHR